MGGTIYCVKEPVEQVPKQKGSERMSDSPGRFRAYTKHHSVSVYTGTGWKPGAVVACYPDRCIIELVNERRTVVCYDARNIRER